MTRHEKSGILTTWGTSLLNKLPAETRNRRKRDASKRRRRNDGAAVVDGARDGASRGHARTEDPVR